MEVSSVFPLLDGFRLLSSSPTHRRVGIGTGFGGTPGPRSLDRIGSDRIGRLSLERGCAENSCFWVLSSECVDVN